MNGNDAKKILNGTIVSVIKSLGFPIAIALLMIYLFIQKDKQTYAVAEKSTEAIQQVTVALVELKNAVRDLRN